MRRELTMLLALLVAATVWAQGSDIALLANGNTVDSDPPPTMREGHVFVPLRAAAEALGARVEYDADARRVTICRGAMCTFVMQDEGLTVDGRLLVGIRQVGEALNAKVDWDGDTRTVRITAN